MNLIYIITQNYHVLTSKNIAKYVSDYIDTYNFIDKKSYEIDEIIFGNNNMYEYMTKI